MQKSLGRYVRSGYGGSGSATRRFGGTAQTAGVLYGALSPAERSQSSLPGGNLDGAVLSGRSANDVMDAVVEAVRPTDGTQDAEASRAAIKGALSELLTKFPDAALLELTEAQRMFAVERYVALDVFHRFWLDVGKTIQDKAPSVKAGLARLREVKDYIKETIAAAFKKVGRLYSNCSIKSRFRRTRPLRNHAYRVVRRPRHQRVGRRKTSFMYGEIDGLKREPQGHL